MSEQENASKSQLTNPTKGRRNDRIPRETRDACQALFCQGVGIKYISEELGVNPRTIEQWSYRHGWREIRDNIMRKHREAAREVISRSLTDASKEVRKHLTEELLEQVEALRREPIKAAANLHNTRRGQGRAAVTRALVESASKLFDWDDEAKVGLIVPMCGPPEDQVPSPVLPIDVEASCVSQAPTGCVRDELEKDNTPQSEQNAEPQ